MDSALMECNVANTPATIIIGYKTRLVEGINRLLPEFRAPTHYKDTVKVAEYVNGQKAEFLAAAKDMPYTGTFDEVVLFDPRNDKTVLWKYPAPDEQKPPVSVRVKNYLLKHYPSAWTDSVTRKPTEVVFVGFDIKTFLKILGIECALPAIAEPCPLNLWYGNSDHRDIAEALLPKDHCKGMTLPYVLKFWRPKDDESGREWDDLLAGWAGPGVAAQVDAEIAAKLARQLGFTFGK